MTTIFQSVSLATAAIALGCSFAMAQQPVRNDKAAEVAKRQRALAVQRCKANRGVDCETDAGLSEWLLHERSRSDAEAQGSRSIHQNAPVVAPRGGK